MGKPFERIIVASIHVEIIPPIASLTPLYDITVTRRFFHEFRQKRGLSAVRLSLSYVIVEHFPVDQEIVFVLWTTED